MRDKVLLQPGGQDSGQPSFVGKGVMVIQSVRRGNDATRRDGQTRLGGQRWRYAAGVCVRCRRTMKKPSPITATSPTMIHETLLSAVLTVSIWSAKMRPSDT